MKKFSLPPEKVIAPEHELLRAIFLLQQRATQALFFYR